MRSENKKRGFTLIELIVVIAIIVILIALIAPNAAKLISTASQTKADANAKSGYTAAMACITETYAAKGAYPSKAEVTSGLVEYLSADAGKGTYSVDYTEKSGALASCTYTDGNVTGIYPKGDSDTENRFVNSVNTTDSAKTVLKDFLTPTTKWPSDIRAVDSTAPQKWGDDSSTLQKLKNALNNDIDDGSWRIVATRSADKKTETSRSLYWTDDDISGLSKGDSVTVKKYTWDYESGKFVYDSTGTAKVKSYKNRSSTYNIMDENTYKAA